MLTLDSLKNLRNHHNLIPTDFPKGDVGDARKTCFILWTPLGRRMHYSAQFSRAMRRVQHVLKRTCSSLVSMESRYGIWLAWEANLSMTRRRWCKDWLI